MHAMAYSRFLPAWVSLQLLAQGVHAAPIESCTLQEDCLTITVEPTTEFCGVDRLCSYRACMALNTTAPTCAKNGDLINHLCDQSGDDECPNPGDNPWDLDEITDEDEITQCQIGGPGETLYFLYKDGDSCDDSIATFTPAGETYQVSCAPSDGNEDFFPVPSAAGGETCTDNDPAVECIWQVTLPPTCVCGDDILCEDPHMQGLRGQSIDWSGVNGGWYSLVEDAEADLHINVRLTAPLPEEFPNRQLVTGVSILSEGHSLVVEVRDPYSTETDGCPEGVSPCLANGGLRVVVDEEEVDSLLRFSREATFADGAMMMSASNLPVECRQFGGDKIWTRMYEEMLHGRRTLRGLESFEDWILSFHHMAAPEWCTKYIAENDLANLQSTHAIFKIETSTVTVRLNAGVNHQGDGDVDWDGRVLPNLDFWQMDVGLEGLDADSPSLSGILGETARPVYDGNGRAVMKGPEAIRGDVEDYRVSGPLDTQFALLGKKE